MDNMTLVAVAVVAVVVIAAALMLVLRRRSQTLRSRYGAEYVTAVDETGDRRKAEAELRHREKRVHAFDLRPLSPREATEFSERWRQVQAEFVDEPGAAVGRADELLGEVMLARGYPPSEFEQRADDLSVHHPRLVSDYREAHQVARLHAEGHASTEDLRRALIHYRALFEDLLGANPQDRPARIEPRSFTPEETRHEPIADSRDADRTSRAADDRSDRERRRTDRPGGGARL